jgi:sepiapterin reductase
MANSINFKDKLAFLLVTGASKGIGAKLAIESARNFKAGSVVVLLARSLSGLEVTKQELLQINPDVKVFIFSIDLMKPSKEELNEILAESLNGSEKFDLTVLIHNVGTIGDVKKWSSDIDDYTELEQYYSTNVFGVIILNNLFLEAFPKDVKKLVVNITSKAAICPFKSFAFYAPGKAAREMFFRVLAEERSDVLVLNYSPGPVETEMTVDAQQNAIASETSQMFSNLRSTGTILTTEQTTKKFLQVVGKGNYKSGDHVDYYDEI